MDNADDITLAAARAATPPRSQLDVLGARVTELEQRVHTVTEHNNRLIVLIEQLHKMQVATIEEVRQRMTDFVTALQKQQQQPPPS